MSLPPTSPNRRVIPLVAAGTPRLHPRAVQGLFNRWRWIMVWLTQLVFYGLPWLAWNGRQAVLFDLEARRFYLFGLVLYPQDFIYLALLLVICALGLFFVTAVAGRVWCGFACPQSVYTALFLRIERLFEGERSARLRLDASPWNGTKIGRRGGKQLAWIALALWTGLSFVGYFTPIRQLLPLALQLGTGPWETFWIGFYGLATYGNAGFLREQVCKHMCPYGRFQSVMFDRDTLIIGYDAARGEPRGARPRGAAGKSQGLGDCIDCTLCVQVCPTGIDIRDGLQSNCIGCAACIDACDQVMDKTGRPRGLIRYASSNGLEQGWSRHQLIRRALRPRVLVYGALLAAAGLAFVLSLAQRTPLRVDVIRDRGVLARAVEQGAVENVYRLHLMNAEESPRRYRLSVSGPAGLSLQGASEVELGSAEERSVVAAVRLGGEQAARLAGQTLPIRFSVERVDDTRAPLRISEPSTFLLPR